METAEELVDAAPAGTDVTVLDPLEKIRAGLSALSDEAKPFDVSTSAGDKAARAFRMKCVTLRTSLDDAYETVNRPLLETQRQARALRDDLKRAVLALETPADVAIKAGEARKEAERQEKQRLEEERVAGLVARVNAIRAMANGALAMRYEELQALAKRVSEVVVGEDFAEFTTAANRARAETFEALKALADSAFEAEERQRKRDAEAAAQAAANKAEQERLAAERKKLDDERAAAKKADAEQARLAKEASEKLKAEREAFERQKAEAAPKPVVAPTLPPVIQQAPAESPKPVGPKCPHCGGELNLAELAAALSAS